MLQILKMGTLDLFWGIPFFFLSVLAMTYFLDSLFKLYAVTGKIATNKKDRNLLSYHLNSGNMSDARKIITSSKDPMILSSGSILNSYIQNRFKDVDTLRNEIKDNLDGLLKIPHEGFFNYFCGVILLVAYAGTLLSFFFLLNNFDINTNDFSELFKYMAVGIKSSIFGVAASALMSTGHVCLEKITEKTEFMREEFCQNLMEIFNNSLAEIPANTFSPDTNGKDVLVKQVIDPKIEQMHELTKRKGNLANLLKKIQDVLNQKMNEYAHKPKLRQEISERFKQKIGQISKESNEIEQQIKELGGAI